MLLVLRILQPDQLLIGRSDVKLLGRRPLHGWLLLLLGDIDLGLHDGILFLGDEFYFVLSLFELL